MLRFNSESDFALFKKNRTSKAKRGKTPSSKSKASIAKNLGISVHAIALAKLSMNPDLATGNQEHYEQIRVFDYFYRENPEIHQFMAAYPAGGTRSKKAAAQMQAEGQAKGYPDIVIDIPSSIYHGARIELKTKKGTLQDSQKDRLKLLHKQGYFCAAVKGADDCIKLILKYCNLQPGEVITPSDFDKKWLETVV